MNFDTQKRVRRKAINTATWVGWLGVLIVDLFQHALPLEPIGYGAKDISLLKGIIIGYIIIGLPLAFILCRLIGTPIWNYLVRTQNLTAAHCIIFGTAVGAIFWVLLGCFFVSEFEFLFILIDFASTVLIGGVAGWVAFLTSKTAIKTEAIL